MTSKEDCIKFLEKKGYTEKFSRGSRFRVKKGKKAYLPREFKIAGYYQFPEPDDDLGSILYAIETFDGRKGIMIDEFWEKPDEQITEFIHVVQTARKRKKKFGKFYPLISLVSFRFFSLRY